MQPTTNRILVIDALRGIALLGILLAHMCYWFITDGIPNKIFEQYQDVGNGIITTITELFISGKFFAYFSFLFGLSFYLQMHSMEQQGEKFIFRYGWRIIIMGIIGFLHHLCWAGDILSIYAPLGLLLIPMRKLPMGLILFLGIALAINLPGKIIQIMDILQQPVNQAAQGNINDYDTKAKAYYDIMTKAGWTALIKHNFYAFKSKFEFQFSSGRIYITYGFFLLGMYTGRKGWLQDVLQYRLQIKKIIARSFWIMLICLLGGLGLMLGNNHFKLGWDQKPAMWLLFSFFYDTFNAALVVLYASGFTSLLYKTKRKLIFNGFATIGKMALTCYLTQTMLALFLFYGVGLGFGGKTSPLLNWGIAIVFFILQAILANLWLKKYQYGPIEWLWRSLTYFKLFPFRRK